MSDNAGYWGDSILTGVTYEYESEPTNPRDQLGGDASQFGRRLLSGRVAGDWHVPVGQNPGEPLVVVFDFKRPATFTEVTTIMTRTAVTSMVVETRDSPDTAWQTVYSRRMGEGHESSVKRAWLSDETHGRYMRVSIGSAGITYVDEVLVWGWAEVSDAYPENITPTWDAELPADTLASIPGMTQTYFSGERFEQWRAAIGRHAAAPAVWSAAHGPSPEAPVLPEANTINAPLSMLTARNETESSYLSLTNTSPDESLELRVESIELRRNDNAKAAGIEARMLVGGALPTAPRTQRLTEEQRLRLLMESDTDQSGQNDDSDVRVMPFFDRGQMLGGSLMCRYMSNGAAIRDYPQLTLPPGGSAIFMLRVVSNHAEPGRYTGAILARTSEDDIVEMKLTVLVANVVLPEMDLWVRDWSNGTDQFPYETQRRREKDALVNRVLGTTVWAGFPEPDSKAAYFGSHGKTYYRIMGLPSAYVHQGYNSVLTVDKLTADDEANISRHVKDLVTQAESLGLDYDQWFVELWDEPQEGNAELFGVLARIIRETDPQVRIYMNPLFWRPGFAPQEVIVDHLADYYNELIDISVPIGPLVGDNQTTCALWARPRFVRAFFHHPPSRAGRQMAWKAFDLGFNGWGYYCYYAPRGNPWDIRTWSSLDYRYQMVFPGPEGPIITPIYEKMRDAWEDYRLLAAVRQAGETALLDELLMAYRRGEPLAELRRRALRELHMTR
ncbi:hypothetical protein ACERK3_07080 [Phycisphaerales bacterium AB-hyl4]|uniref:Glycoside hydrolase 123 C-terminal domain-containing protein n=1 Tax=Natronomicrosphaera hydrolytica TaxID=3242702 RepID=A0ABV4U710_9BACT